MHYGETVIWKKAMRLAEQVCRVAEHLPRQERFGMRLQITRAAISIPSNIAEGWTRESRRECRQFLAIAHGSLAELNTQLILCIRLGWLPHAALADALQLSEEVSRMLTVLRRSSRSAA